MSMRAEVPATTGRKRRGEGHTRREEILEAARGLFLTHGYESVTIRKIAEQVGVSAPALYLYFPDKDAIVLELCDQTFGQLLELFGEIRRLYPPGRERMARSGEAFIRFGLAHPDEYRLIFVMKPPQRIIDQGGHRATVTDPSLPGSKGPLAFAMVMQDFAELAAHGHKLAAEPVTCAELFWMFGHGIVTALITKPEFPWSDKEALIATGVQAGLDGLLGPAA